MNLYTVVVKTESANPSESGSYTLDEYTFDEKKGGDLVPSLLYDVAKMILHIPGDMFKFVTVTGVWKITMVQFEPEIEQSEPS